MLIENTLEGQINRVEVAIERLKQFEPPEDYYLAFSGGKDSIVCYELCKMSGVKFDTHFNFTTVDPPELLRFIRDNYPDCVWDRPEKTMWELIIENNMPPTRLIRFCCRYLKERGGEGRTVITGVRREESVKRQNRKMIDVCIGHNKKMLNIIVDWSEKDVWQFIKQRELKYCCLYDEGYKRIGCIMCPMKNTKGMLQDKKRYPNFYKAYIKTFRELIDKQLSENKTNKFNTPEEMFTWWVYGKDINQGDKLFEEEQIFNYE